MSDRPPGAGPKRCAMRPSLVQALVLALCLLAALTVVRPTADPTESPVAGSEELSPSTMSARLFAKMLVAADAAAGRLSLVEAAALFRELHRLPPGPLPIQSVLENRCWSKHLPDRTEDEQLCLWVIGYIFGQPDDGLPSGSAAAVQRLEAEFAEELSRGNIRLPAVPPAAIEELIDRARRELARTQSARPRPLRRLFRDPGPADCDSSLTETSPRPNCSAPTPGPKMLLSRKSPDRRNRRL